MYEDINCPYCDAPQDINHDDGYGYEEGVKHQQTCCDCGKEFVYETSISFYYEAEKADCLNGAAHNYKPTRTVPRDSTKMECSMCGGQRPCTTEEMEAVLKGDSNHE